MKERYISQWVDSYNDQIKVRAEKRDKIIKDGGNPYKNGLTPNVLSSELIKRYSDNSKDELAEMKDISGYKVAGRVLLVRSFGKAAFLQFDDGSARFQLYVKKAELSDQDKKEFDALDYGDIVFAEGDIFKTNKGELSLKVKEFRVLTKSLRPLPEKFHGLNDPELRYRMRYVDLIVNPQIRETFRKRSEIVKYIRDYFGNRDYLEVETPMLHPLVGGAAAKPFETYHNSLGMDMVLRIAPELHLKRLITGGFQRVFEMNRLFRNEGLSLKHNPEFTTIEFYQAYATFEDMIEITEELISGLARDVMKSETLPFGDREISFAKPFQRMSMKDAVLKYSDLTESDLNNKEAYINLLVKKGHERKDIEKNTVEGLLVLCFEEFAESNLISPTFITDFPAEVSPLSRKNDNNPNLVDRFELFINGWEIANAFSELNDPQDQLERFADQAQKKSEGDEEACDIDYDYIRCLEYGMPPTAGEGIGIDRLCMLLTNNASIRDVILFPQLKKETFFEEVDENQNLKK